MNQKDLRDLSAVYDRILQENVYDQQKSRFDSDVSNKFADKAGHTFKSNDLTWGIKDEYIIDKIQQHIDSVSSNGQEQINLKEILDNPSTAEKFVRLVKFYVATTDKSGNPPRPDSIGIDLKKLSFGLKNDQIADAIYNYVSATKDGQTNWKSYQ